MTIKIRVTGQMNKIVMTVLSAVLFSGCVMVDYTGQKFPETPLSKEVKFFNSRQNIPVDEYTIVGRFVLTAPQKSDMYTFQKELLEKARNYGGDAVCLVDVKIVQRGFYPRQDEEFGAPETSGKPTVDESQRGAASPLVGEKSFMQRRVARALLLKKRVDVEKLLK